MLVKEFDKPTYENAFAFTSPEKQIFCPNTGCPNTGLSYETAVVKLGDNVQLSFVFRVTSFEAGLSVRLTPENKEMHRYPEWIGVHPEWPSFGQLVTIGEIHWGENGSGFNKKFIIAKDLVRSIALGDWSQVNDLVQSNRSTSYSPRTGEWNTRFSCPKTSDAAVAHEWLKNMNAFPLPLPFQPT